MSETRTLFNLNKVFIADTVLEHADGILGIAHGSVDAQLLTYFPKLCLTPEIQRKPVRVIPEGIRLEPVDYEAADRQGKEPGTAGVQGDGDRILSMLSHHPGRFADFYAHVYAQAESAVGGLSKNSFSGEGEGLLK
jgi:hypothetical protein